MQIKKLNSLPPTKNAESTKITMLDSALLVIFTLSAGYFIYIRFNWMAGWKYPPTTDSFFYLKEFRSRLLDGAGYYVSYTPFFSLITYLAKFFAVSDEVLIYQLCVVTGLILFSSALAIAASQRGELKSDKVWLIPLVFQIPWISDLLFYRHYAFLKQALSISSLLFGLALYLNAAAENKKFSKIIYPTSLFFIAIGVITHLFSAAVFASFLLYSFLIATKKNKSSLFFGLFAALGVLLVAGLRDKELFEFSAIRLQLTWQIFCEAANCRHYDLFEFILGGALFLCLLAFFFLNGWKDRTLLFFLGLFLALSLPIWDISSQLAFRAAFSSAWMVFFALAWAAGSKGGKEATLCVAATLSLALGGFYLDRLKPVEIMIPAEKLEAYRVPLKEWIPEGSFIQAPHTAQFKISYFLDRYSARLKPEGKEFVGYFVYQPDNLPHHCEVLNDPSLAIDRETECITIEDRWSFLKQ